MDGSRKRLRKSGSQNPEEETYQPSATRNFPRTDAVGASQRRGRTRILARVIGQQRGVQAKSTCFPANYSVVSAVSSFPREQMLDVEKNP